MNSTAERIFKDYDKAVRYNQSIGLYERVKQNELFYIGRQWEGVNAPDLEKPTLNFIKRVVSYFIAMLVSDDIAVNFTPAHDSEENRTIAKVLSKQVEQVLEAQQVRAMNRNMLRDCAVDGDAGYYFYMDMNAFGSEQVKGSIAVESMDSTKVLFGNPYIREVQKQPWIILVQRLQLEEVRRMAQAAGMDKDCVRPDNESSYQEEHENDELVTVVTRLWKKNGTVHYIKACRSCLLTDVIDTGYTLYPVTWMNWERVKDSYHGQAAVTGLIPNQIFVNKTWAMAMEQVKQTAFPKVIYDASRIKRWTNRVGEAIGVAGGVNEAVATGWRAPDMSGQVLELVEKTISYSRDFMGASDAALGNIRPDNTSAIIAVQKASAAPLELQRLDFFKMMEDTVRVMVDIICTDYGVRTVSMTDEAGEERLVEVDFGLVDWKSMQLKIDVGTASYWSELTQIQTLDNLFSKGIISDAVTYLEGIPDQYIKGKNKIIAKLKEQQEQMSGGVQNGFMPEMQDGTAGRQMPQPKMPQLQ
ncbi:MAG: hypothetical protein IKV41_05695 [Oscillospiraceae bacterium]|nr:hypothetical protein [Oscillospiraceae bacterium]